MSKPLVRLVAAIALTFGVALGGWYTFSHILHYEVRTVGSGSMEPLFVPGSRIIIKMGEQPPVGSVVLFRNVQMGDNTTHVYLGTRPDGTIRTRGLANRDEDNFAPTPRGSDVLGRVVYHTEIFTLRYWTSPRGLTALVIFLVAAVMFVVAQRMDDEEGEGDPRCSNAV
ncbi:MAG TPA: S24/S26 family peptidase [Candidatus Saccharimonadales bacterium]